MHELRKRDVEDHQFSAKTRAEEARRVPARWGTTSRESPPRFACSARSKCSPPKRIRLPVVMTATSKSSARKSGGEEISRIRVSTIRRTSKVPDRRHQHHPRDATGNRRYLCDAFRTESRTNQASIDKSGHNPQVADESEAQGDMERPRKQPHGLVSPKEAGEEQRLLGQSAEARTFRWIDRHRPGCGCATRPRAGSRRRPETRRWQGREECHRSRMLYYSWG
jgi:hypothetical protein